MKEYSSKDYEKMGQQMASIIDSLNPDKKALWRTSFLKGIFSGLGGIIGATVGIALLLWGLSLFGQVPLIGHFVNNVQETVQNR